MTVADDGADPDDFRYNVASFEEYAVLMAMHSEWVDVTWS